MAFTATLHRETRAAERHAVGLEGTLRDADRQPFDVSVIDLSVDGFRAVGEVVLAPGAAISIGLPALGARPALVVRAESGEYGCRFRQRLSAAELSSAVGAVVTAPIPFPAPARAGLLLETGLPPIERYSGRTRAALIGGAVAITWGSMLLARFVVG